MAGFVKPYSKRRKGGERGGQARRVPLPGTEEPDYPLLLKPYSSAKLARTIRGILDG